MTAIDYSDKDLQGGGRGFSWTEAPVGTALIGTVSGFKKQIRENKKDGTTKANGVYTLTQDDGSEIFLEVGQAFLKGLFHEKQVQIGDRIKIVYTENRNVGQPSPMKVFTLDVARGGTQAPTTTTDAAVAHLEAQLGAKVVDSTPPPF